MPSSCKKISSMLIQKDMINAHPYAEIWSPCAYSIFEGTKTMAITKRLGRWITQSNRKAKDTFTRHDKCKRVVVDNHKIDLVIKESLACVLDPCQIRYVSNSTGFGYLILPCSPMSCKYSATSPHLFNFMLTCAHDPIHGFPSWTLKCKWDRVKLWPPAWLHFMLSLLCGSIPWLIINLISIKVISIEIGFKV